MFAKEGKFEKPTRWNMLSSKKREMKNFLYFALFSAIAFSLSSRPGHICCCSVFLVCVFFVLFLPTALGVATFISRDSSKQKLAKDVSSWQPR